MVPPDSGLIGREAVLREAPEWARPLLVFLNEQWTQELDGRATINMLHPEPERECYEMHTTSMLRYEQIFRVVRRAAVLEDLLRRIAQVVVFDTFPNGRVLQEEVEKVLLGESLEE